MPSKVRSLTRHAAGTSCDQDEHGGRLSVDVSGAVRPCPVVHGSWRPIRALALVARKNFRNESELRLSGDDARPVIDGHAMAGRSTTETEHDGFRRQPSGGQDHMAAVGGYTSRSSRWTRRVLSGVSRCVNS
jgi:hypothetical protein